MEHTAFMKATAHAPQRGDENKRVLVVGGLVLDIISSSTCPIIRATSNIGTIQQSSGGSVLQLSTCLPTN